MKKNQNHLFLKISFVTSRKNIKITDILLEIINRILDISDKILLPNHFLRYYEFSFYCVLNSSIKKSSEKSNEIKNSQKPNTKNVTNNQN